MNERYCEVRVWLEKVCGGDTYPQYEVSYRTVNILHQLLQKNEQQDRWVNHIIDDLKQKTEEYIIEGERICSLLSELGLVPCSLSQSGLMSLRVLTNVAVQLAVRDPSRTSLLMALTDLCQTGLKLHETRKMEDRILQQLCLKTQAAMHRSSSLCRTLNIMNEEAGKQGEDLEKKAKQAGFLQSKAKEYRRRIVSLEKELSRSGADSSIYHSTLIKKEEELKSLREKLHPMKAKLDSYYKLPPNMALAKVKVEEAKQELAALEEELSSHIDLMHM